MTGYRTYRVSPLLGSPYDSSTSSRTGLRRFHAPDAARRLLGRFGSEDLMASEDGCVSVGVLREALPGLRVAVVNPSQRWKARGMVAVMCEGRWGG